MLSGLIEMATNLGMETVGEGIRRAEPTRHGPEVGDIDSLGARLSVQLSAVRRILRGCVIVDRSSIRLDLDYIDVDIERWFAQTDDTAIVAGHDGEFPPDDRYEDWSAPLRDEIRARFGVAARRLAEVSTA